MEDDNRETCWWIHLLEKLVLSAASICRNYSKAIEVECDVAIQHGYSQQWIPLHSFLMTFEMKMILDKTSTNT
jgi:hypothetical protein